MANTEHHHTQQAPTHHQRKPQAGPRAALEAQFGPKSAMAMAGALRTSTRKLNLVAQSIRGKSATEALRILTFSPRRIALEVKKALQSAIANAENNHALDVDRLQVREASVGKTRVFKKFRPRGRGKGERIDIDFSRVRIVVAEGEKAPRKGASQGARKPVAGMDATATAAAKPVRKPAAAAKKNTVPATPKDKA